MVDFREEDRYFAFTPANESDRILWILRLSFCPVRTGFTLKVSWEWYVPMMIPCNNSWDSVSIDGVYLLAKGLILIVTTHENSS